MKPKRPLSLLRSLSASAFVLSFAVAGASEQPPRGDSAVRLEVELADPYRWMEDLESPEVRAWISSQNSITRETLDSDPRMESIRRRMTELMAFRRQFPPIRRGNRLFIAEGDVNTLGDSSIIVREGARSRVLVPPAAGADEFPHLARNPSGSIFPSPDGRYVAYHTSRRDSSWTTLRIVETASGRVLPDRIEGLFGSLGVVAWLPGGRSFLYGRFDYDPEAGAQQARTNHRIEFHELGTPQSRDRVVLSSPDDPIRWYFPHSTEDGRWVVISSSRGSDRATKVWLAKPDKLDSMREIFPGVDASISFIGAIGDRLWFQTNEYSERESIIRLDVDGNGRTKTTHVLTPEDNLLYADLIGERLIVFLTHDAAPRAEIHRLDGTFERELPLPPLTTVWGPPTGGIGFVGGATDRYAYFIASGLFDPGTVYRLDPKSGKVDIFQSVSSAIDPTAYDGRQVFYESRDGTRVPMWLAWKRGLDRSIPQPLFMYAYGALGWSAFPWYQPNIVGWLDQGGIYAMPGIRGGGEYGEPWHKGGTRGNRENAFEDYVSAAEWLVDEGYTTRTRIVGNGGSISGALAAEALVRRPDLFGAMVVDIPVTDLLRYDQFNGGKLWAPDLGATDDPRDAAFLVRHSPYHLIRDGQCYPPTLVTAGEKDQSAAPHHAYKFTAALQYAQSCTSPVMIQIVEGAGHNFGTSTAQTAETWARQIVFSLRSVQ